VAQHRSRWRVWQRYMDGERFVFIDETAATTAMTRLSGWGPRGERLVDAAPAGHWKTTTVVAGLRSTGVVAPLVLDGPMTGTVFRTYVEQVLAPALEPGDITSSHFGFLGCGGVGWLGWGRLRRCSAGRARWRPSEGQGFQELGPGGEHNIGAQGLQVVEEAGSGSKRLAGVPPSA
jgi:hypothetical protein